MTADARIKKEADRFRREFGLFSVTCDTIVDALERLGYTVVFYSPAIDDDDAVILLCSLHIMEQARHSRAFTYGDENYRLVFVRDGLSDEEKRIVLAHELGHIRCGHMTDRPFLVGQDILQEYEANEFSHYLLNGRHIPTKKKKALTVSGIAAAVLCVLVCICFCIKKTDTASCYYVTRTGTKYHTADCVIIRDKDGVRALTEEEFRSGKYAPCGICHPDS